ncbi:prepilin-type N-terminal cleavage/methylation domain-containing protein [Elusimicrobium simillimum]|uniref:prepilin-type N-terminal cleavage/methylation domain-containing protein n=1 Tax=Elusimicrobium simillimum TaxID=3143438 RepID=UPI003C6FC5CC
MKKGFTLVELLIVVVIVTLVVVVAVPSFRNAQENSKNQRAQALLIDIAGAVQNYKATGGGKTVAGYLDKKHFPSTPSCGAVDETNLDCLAYAGLLKPINWDADTTNYYNGYQFQICTNLTQKGCCNNALVAMQSNKESGRFIKTKCAWITKMGELKHNYDLSSEI